MYTPSMSSLRSERPPLLRIHAVMPRNRFPPNALQVSMPLVMSRQLRHRSEMAPLRLARTCKKACDPQKTRKPYARQRMAVLGLSDAHPIDCHCYEHRCGDGFVIFRITLQTHHHVMIALRSSACSQNCEVIVHTEKRDPMTDRITIAKHDITVLKLS